MSDTKRQLRSLAPEGIMGAVNDTIRAIDRAKDSAGILRQAFGSDWAAKLAQTRGSLDGASIEYYLESAKTVAFNAKEIVRCMVAREEVLSEFSDISGAQLELRTRLAADCAPSSFYSIACQILESQEPLPEAENENPEPDQNPSDA